MDIAQLKLHATRTRALLEQANHSVNHNQSLDLVAALPGLRNWPEVQAFPDRVATCELDLTSTGRLSFRLKRKFGLDVSPQVLLTQLTPPGQEKRAVVTQIWPTGPEPGVYITTSLDAVSALLNAYEEASDGALFYAEGIGDSMDSMIDLGENGLWSSGLSRVPSGTLLVVGPLRLDQQSWNSSGERLEMACLHALNAGHRVAVLLETPTPGMLAEDVQLLIRQAQPEGADTDTALKGVVTEDGTLQPVRPFSRHDHAPVVVPSIATLDAIPPSARQLLRKCVERHKSGLLFFGSSVIHEHWSVDLVVAGLALTEHAGPAARIMPRHRSTPSKDWDVPEALKQIPFLPSVQSAYEQGYRRMVIDPGYTQADVLLQYGNDVLFIAGTYAGSASDTYLSAVRSYGLRNDVALMGMVIALLGVTHIPAPTGDIVVPDLFLRDEAPDLKAEKFDDMIEMLESYCTLRLADQLKGLLAAGAIDLEHLRKEKRNHAVSQFLADLGEDEHED